MGKHFLYVISSQYRKVLLISICFKDKYTKVQRGYENFPKSHDK
jgi:hypothetical protein